MKQSRNMNKEQQPTIDEAYKRYVMLPKELSDVISNNEKFNGRNLTQEEFINKIKTDTEFSEKWGLKIEERELSLEERTKYKKERGDRIARTFAAYTHQMLDNANIPTRLITITYNNETIESYEN